MKKLTRRQAVGMTAMAGAVVYSGTASTGTALAQQEYDAVAEKGRVMECGMTDAEADCWVAVIDATAKFFELPELHPTDNQEVAQAIHIIQNKLLSRPAYRKYKSLPRDEK